MPTEPRVNILMVDDTPSNLFVLEATLGELGQNLVRAGSGVEALRRLLNDDFALILMDVQMPGMDGFEVADLIRQRDRTRLTPIIFLTAYERTDVEMFRGYSVGAVDFLFKPIVPEVLRSKVRVFVDLHWATEQVRRQAEQIRENERREMEHRLAEERRRAEEDRWQLTLRIARDVQQKLFPDAPPACPGFDLAGRRTRPRWPAAITSTTSRCADGAIGVAIGDVCGHGFGPALLMAATRAYLPAPGADQCKGRRHPHPGQSRPRRGRRRRPVRHPDPGPPRSGHADARLLQRRAPARLRPGARRVDPRGPRQHRRAAGHHPTKPNSPRRRPSRCEPGDLVLLLTDGIIEAVGPDRTLLRHSIARSTSSGPTATSPRAGSSRPCTGPYATSPAAMTSPTT